MHGASDGSVDRDHNIPGSRAVAANPKRMAAECFQRLQPPYYLDESRRECVLDSVLERCSNRGWSLLAVHVRTNHVHVLVDAEARPERVMNDLKSYASRLLNKLGFDEPDRKRWARHGSTRWLWSREQVSAALEYVIDKQGCPMAVYERKPLPAVAAR
jgi:REP element-mobilizing transposase RayT